MKILKVIVKVILSILVMMFFTQGASFSDPASAVVFFAACYGLVTFYMFAFTNGMPIFVGYGLIGMAFAVILTLCLPGLILMIPVFLLEAILPGEIGDIIGGIIIIIVCLGCIAFDVLHIVRLFKPDLLGGDRVGAVPADD